MKQILLIVLLSVTSHCMAQQKNNQLGILASSQSQILEMEELINTLGRQGVGDIYFQRLKESQVALTQLKASKLSQNSDIQMLNELYFAIDDIINPDFVESNRLKLDRNVTKGSGSGVIRGTVSPIAANDNPVAVLYDELGNYIAYNEINALGRYVFTSLPAGKYLIFVASNQNNIVDVFYPSTPCEDGLGQGCQLQDLSSIDLLENQVLEGIDMDFILKPIISGSVIDSANSEGIQSVQLMFYNELGELVSSSYSDRDGHYSASLRKPGSYKVVANHTRFQPQLYNHINCIGQCDISQGVNVVTSYDQQTANVDFNLTVSASISGTLKDIDTQEFINGRVGLYNELNQQVSAIEYFNNGLWSLDFIPPGQYKIINTYQYSYFAGSYNNIICSSVNVSSCFSEASNLINHGTQNLENIALFAKELNGTRIKGRVLDGLGQPIRNARIFIFKPGYNTSVVDYINTNGDGYYDSGILKAGNYHIVAHAFSYQTELYPNIVCTNTVCDYSQGDLIELTSLADTVNVNFELSGLTGSISGQVIDNDGNPVVNQAVFAIGLTSSSYYTTSVSDRTDLQGNYTINSLPVDDYNVQVSTYGYVDEVYPSIVTVNQTSVENIDFQLTSHGKVSFNIISNSSNPVTDGYLRIYNEFGSYVRYMNYDETIRLEEGNYYFLFMSDSYLNKVYGGDNCTSCVSISGQVVNVTNDSEQVLTMNVDEYLRVNINTSGGNYLVRTQVFDENDNYLYYKTINNGYMHITQPENVKLKFTNNQYYGEIYDGINCFDNPCDISNGTVLTPQINSSITVNLNLVEANSSISGRIYEYNGQPPQSYSARVNLYKNLTDNAFRVVYADDDGYYSFENIEKGSYYIKVEGNSVEADTYNGNIACDDDCENQNIASIPLIHGQSLTNVDIHRVERGTISGEGITTSNGDLVPATIYFYRVEDNSSAYVFAINVINGSIGDVHLPEGTYRLVLVKSYNPKTLSAYPNHSCDMEVTNYYECSLLSDLIIVTNGTNYHFTSFQIFEAGKFIINLRDKVTNAPVRDASVRLYDTNGNSVGYYSDPQRTGQVIAQVPSGSYYLFANAPSQSSYINSLYDNIDCSAGIGFDCLISQGQLLSITNETNIEFDMKLSTQPLLKINAFNSVTNQSIDYFNVHLYDENFNLISSSSVNDSYLNNLDFGNYYITVNAFNGYFNVAYPNVACENYATINECLINSSPIIMSNYNTTQEINMLLTNYNAVNGVVKNESGNNLENIIIDLWSEGEVVNSAISYANGGFTVPVQPGDYYLSTDTNEYVNEIYQDIECEYAAVTGLCDISQGQVINLPSNNPLPIIINIELGGSDMILKNGFE